MGVMDYIRGLANRDRDEGDLVARSAGEATGSDGGTAVTGYSGPSPRRSRRIVVKSAGDATASGRGSRSASGVGWT